MAISTFSTVEIKSHVKIFDVQFLTVESFEINVRDFEWEFYVEKTGTQFDDTIHLTHLRSFNAFSPKITIQTTALQQRKSN